MEAHEIRKKSIVVTFYKYKHSYLYYDGPKPSDRSIFRKVAREFKISPKLVKEFVENDDYDGNYEEHEAEAYMKEVNKFKRK